MDLWIVGIGDDSEQHAENYNFHYVIWDFTPRKSSERKTRSLYGKYFCSVFLKLHFFVSMEFSGENQSEHFRAVTSNVIQKQQKFFHVWQIIQKNFGFVVCRILAKPWKVLC